MSLFMTNKRTKKKFRRRKARKVRNGHREGSVYTSPKEKEKLGHGYFKNESVI